VRTGTDTPGTGPHGGPYASQSPAPSPSVSPEVERLRQNEARYAESLRPAEALIAAWDFEGAEQALAKIRFDEKELAERLAARRAEVQRLGGLKARMMAKVNEAQPPLKKSVLGLRGLNGDVVKADAQRLQIKLASGKTESLAWRDLGTGSVQKLVQLVLERQKADDWLAAGSLALVCKDPASAERCFAEARTLGADTEPLLGPLAAAALARAQEAIKHGRLDEAEAGLAKLAEQFGKTPWFAANQPTMAAAQDAIRTGRAANVETEAEKLYQDAVKAHESKQLFDLKLLVERLKADYPNSRAVTDASRRPTLAELAEAVSKVGRFITVRQDGRGDHKTIQAALDSAPAHSCIEVQDAGPYREALTVKQDGVTLRGKKGVWPVVTSAGKKSDSGMVVVSADRVVIERLVLLHSPEEGSGPCLRKESMSTEFSCRSCGILGGYAFFVRDGMIDTCFIIGNARGHKLLLVNSHWTGRENSLSNLSAIDLQNLSVRAQTIQFHPQGGPRSTLRSCSFSGVVRINGASGVVDCIAASIGADQPGARIEHCALYGPQPYAGSAKPGKGCISDKPIFVDPANLDYRLAPNSPCRGKASDGGDLGVRYTPEMIEIIKVALALRAQGLVKF